MDVAMGTIKLMAAANPASLMVIDGQGQIPLHIACRLSDLDIVKSLVEANEECLMIEDSNQDMPLHIVCRLGKCDIVSYLSTKPENGAIVKDKNGYLPIQLLLSNAECNRNSTEYVEAFMLLFQINPEMSVQALSKSNESRGDELTC
jgi:hypothetical protein